MSRSRWRPPSWRPSCWPLAAALRSFWSGITPGLIFAGDCGPTSGASSLPSAVYCRPATPGRPPLVSDAAADLSCMGDDVLDLAQSRARTVPGRGGRLAFHQLISRRIVRRVFDDDEARRMLMRNNRTSPYLGASPRSRCCPLCCSGQHAGADPLFASVRRILYLGLHVDHPLQGSAVDSQVKPAPGACAMAQFAQ